MPITAYPALTDVGAWRGHGLAIPPLLGSGPAAFGGSYTRRQIAGWVDRAAAAGIDLVPEVDLPGHCFAALAAVPALRDPCDRSRAVSVQSFVDNVLNPGVAADVAVPRGRRRRARRPVPRPVAARRRRRGAGRRVGRVAARHRVGGRAWRRRGRPPIGRGVHGRDRPTRARRRPAGRSGCGRRRPRVARWPRVTGTSIGWKSAADCRRLAAAGHDVVAAPAERYYLDMAASSGLGRSGHGLGRPLVGRRRRGLRGRSGLDRDGAGRTSSASRPAPGPSTSPTARRWNACSSPASTPSPPRPGPPDPTGTERESRPEMAANPAKNGAGAGPIVTERGTRPSVALTRVQYPSPGAVSGRRSC